MSKSITTPTIEVNDDIIAIVPNSLAYKSGAGDKDVKAASSGGGSVETIIVEDATTKVSMVKFKLFPTKENLKKIKLWSTLYGSTIRLSDQGFAEPFRKMVLTTEPENALGADGEIELEWKGQPNI